MTNIRDHNGHLARPSIGWVLERLRVQYGEPEHSVSRPPIDELVMTILSQHTSDINTERAFSSLKATFPSWDAVVNTSDAAVADAIRVGGLANVKATRIRRVLQDVRERSGSYDLSFLADVPLDDARAWLTDLYGVGPKTASCVLLFSLNRAAIPVDTHVHRVTLRLGLIPKRTSADRAHELLEATIPVDDTYAAHMLFIKHGRATCVARCPRCARCVLVQCCPAARAFLSGEQE